MLLKMIKNKTNKQNLVSYKHMLCFMKKKRLLCIPLVPKDGPEATEDSPWALKPNEVCLAEFHNFSGLMTSFFSFYFSSVWN